jgi:3-hydroxybutyrate dehydrogenase
MRLENRAAVVTGSTSGIGLGIARALAGAGADVMLNGFGDPKQIEAIQREMETEHRVKVRYDAADLAQPAAVEALIASADREFGHVDILVNNAGIQFTAPVQSFPTDRWDAILSINLSAAFHTTRTALPLMLERNWGRVINVASVHGLVASMHKAAYVAAKHGLLGLTKVVALETAATGITCNAICPGWVLTPLVQRQIDDLATRAGLSPDMAQRQLLGEKQPSLEFATPEQIGALAVYLCSDSAAQIRGAAIPVDGAWLTQ